MKIIIDRLENEFAVVELKDGEFVNMPVCLLPTGAKAGDILSIEIEKNDTVKRREEIKNKINNLFHE